MGVVFVVMGATGEYSDHREWPVCWCSDLTRAQELVTQLKEKTRSYTAKHIREQKRQYPRIEAAPSWDPGFQYDYTGVDYYYLTVPQDEPEGES